MTFRDYNKSTWIYKNQEYSIDELGPEQVIDFFITTFKLVKSNPSLVWMYNSTLYSLVINRAKEVLEDLDFSIK